MAGHPTLFSCQVNTAEQLGNEVTRVLGGWKHALLFFVGAGDWCKWCNALTADMAANPVLQEFCAARGIEMIGVNLVRKDEDTTGLRIAYQIKSIPTDPARAGRRRTRADRVSRFRRSRIHPLFHNRPPPNACSPSRVWR